MTGFSVWIVEDELLSANYVKSIVSSFPEFPSPRVFFSAEDALAEFGESAPDILITDIKLLGMDGLELVSEIRKQGSDIIVILISGYRLFEFAKKAITLSIMDYLLKPIDRKELTRLLSQARDKLQEEKANKEREMLASVFDNPGNSAYLEPGQVMICLIHRICELPWIGACEKTVKETDSGFMIVPYQAKDVVIIKKAEDKSASSSMSRLVTNLSYEEQKAVRNQIIVVSNRIHSTQEIGNAVRKLSELAHAMFSFGDSKTIVLEEASTSHASMKTESFIRALSHIYPRDWVNFREDLKATQKEWEEKKTPISVIKNQTLAIIDRFQQLSPAKLSSSLLYGQALDIIESSESYADLSEGLGSFFDEIIEISSGRKENDASYDLFRRVSAFLQNNVRENYTLSDVANRFGISQPYLSKLFRTYSGKTFKEFVLDYKIDTAIRIMRSDNSILIKEVADAVGFESFYFSTVFSRIAGEYPSQFMKKLRHNDAESS